ncbi:MAG: sterol desaturase family protein [Cyclobacteriaceae bacterium]
MNPIISGIENRWLALWLVIFLRYFILAAVAWLLYYQLFRTRWSAHKLQQLFPQPADYYREFGYSVLTTLIFATIGYIVFFTPLRQYTQVYRDIQEYGTTWFFGSVVLMLVVHDTYFYWTHRWMHLPSVYRYFHKVHHLSTNPSPWAAFAFHPLEAIVEAMIVVVIAVIMPAHPMAIALFLLIMMVYNVYGHLGYEWYRPGFLNGNLGKWINSSTAHNRHHRYFTGNYGLYFLWWDRWMGTLRKD